MLRAVEDKLEDVEEGERLETVRELLLPMLPERIARELDNAIFAEALPIAQRSAVAEQKVNRQKLAHQQVRRF